MFSFLRLNARPKPVTNLILLIVALTGMMSGISRVAIASPPAVRSPTTSEGLQGVTYRRREGTEGQAISTPGMWQGLPPKTMLGSGWLLPLPGNIGSPQSFGVHLLDIGKKTFLSFELISNFADGTTFTRILEARDLDSATVFFPCAVNGKNDPTVLALLTPLERMQIDAQQPNQMDDRPATITSPQNVIRLDTKGLRIVSLDSDEVTCTGYPLE